MFVSPEEKQKQKNVPLCEHPCRACWRYTASQLKWERSNATFSWLLNKANCAFIELRLQTHTQLPILVRVCVSLSLCVCVSLCVYVCTIFEISALADAASSVRLASYISSNFCTSSSSLSCPFPPPLAYLNQCPLGTAYFRSWSSERIMLT